MSATSPLFLSIIVPAYNEAATIVNTLTRIRAFLEMRSIQYELIVSADGEDDTRKLAAGYASGDSRFKVIGSPHRRGKGRGVREGISLAAGNIVGFIDADYKTPIDEIDKLLPWFNRGFDVVIGSRKVADAEIQIRQPIYRRLGSRAFSLVMSNLVGLRGIRDTQCGFKFFTHAAAKRLFSLQRIDGYMFDVEILRLAMLLEMKVKEVGVRWWDDGDSRYHPITGTWRNARELLRIRRMRYDLSDAQGPRTEDDSQYSSLAA
ncbi:MAG TPA: dolichyl-phosphate beta-glucosyltransferase [Humisphaera sp.]|jgi:dolichyl-phosphate beta-glucosyltransferase|nr:dolichyl-phosphate beta-glucosyltransferase [Humisphaera sp.]